MEPAPRGAAVKPYRRAGCHQVLGVRFWLHWLQVWPSHKNWKDIRRENGKGTYLLMLFFFSLTRFNPFLGLLPYWRREIWNATETISHPTSTASVVPPWWVSPSEEGYFCCLISDWKQFCPDSSPLCVQLKHNKSVAGFLPLCAAWDEQQDHEKTGGKVN